MKNLALIITISFSIARTFSQTLPCDVVQISANPKHPIYYSPDSSKYFINKQDTIDGVFQIYVGNKGDTNTISISDTYTNGNCCGLFRHWKTRNKTFLQWHKSGNYIICGVEKEFYNELWVPYNIRLGWIQSGLWLDIWAVKPDGSQWYSLADVDGFTGPAFTPDGTKCVYAEAMPGSNLAVDVFGVWKFKLADFFIDGNGTPSLTNATDISPSGARWLEPGTFGPDGVSLLFNSDIGMSNAEGQDQYIMDISNGNITNLTNSPKIWDEHGVFSPDGKKILFMSSYPYQADTNSYHTLTIKTEFMLMNTDGSDLQQLTHFREPGYLESSEGIAATGHFTPDGKRIYCQSLIFPDYENWIIDFHGNCGNAILSVNEKENTEPAFQLYPNPVTETLHISFPDNQQHQIQIYNSIGMLVNEISTVQSNAIDLANFSSGLYFIHLKNHPEQAQKLIKY